MKDITTIGIDLAKSVFYIHGVDSRGKTVLKKKMNRAQVLPFFSNLPHCLVGMETGCGTHYWAREIMALGHEVKIMAAQFVKPYIKSNKSDTNDAEAICEAVTRPSMRFVGVKTTSQQDIQSLHRIRERIVKSRVALANEIRGLLTEYGIVFKTGVSFLIKSLPKIITDTSNGLNPMTREIMIDLHKEIYEMTERIKKMDKKIEAIRVNHPIAKVISTIPGVGPLASTAIIAQVSDPSMFRNGREFSAYLGLVPKHTGSGGKQQMLGISKRGDKYIRKMLIHGARAHMAQNDMRGRNDARANWARSLKERRGHNKAIVALANKMARTIWVAMNQADEFEYAA